MNHNKKTKHQMSELYSKVSGTYGETRHDFFSDFGKCCFANLTINEDARILDVATGKGAMLFPALDKTGHSGKVYGIDISPGMIRETAAKVKEQNFSNAELKVMDGEMMDFEDNLFDLVTCGFAIFFFPDLQKVLAEFKRVLNPSGQIALSTWLHDPRSAFCGGGWFWDLYGKYVPSHQVTGTGPDFGTEEGMFKILNKSGFKEIRFSKVEKTYYYADEEEWWQEQSSHGGRRALETIPGEKLAGFKTEVFAKLQEYKDSRGVYNKIPVLFSYAVK